MTRLALWMVASLCLVGCSTKPSEDECHQAITNMTRLMGTENLADTSAIQSQVRRCKGGSTKKSVQCAIKAQTLDDLRKCDFFKVPENAKGIGAEQAGSAAVGSGSAAAGSAAVGSAGADATGSAAVGSAGAGSAGSADGSAAAGSAAAGSAMGSAAPSGPAKQ
jgi:hypothetical protein